MSNETPERPSRVPVIIVTIGVLIIALIVVVLVGTSGDDNGGTAAAPATSSTDDIDAYDPATDTYAAPAPEDSDVIGENTDEPTDDFTDDEPAIDEDTSEKVTFRIGGKGRALQVTIFDGQISQQTDVKLPWKKTITVDDGDTTGWNVNAQRSSGNSGSITCSIEHDGVETTSNKSKGPYAVVACSDAD